jgi:aminomethyltransferase
MLMNFQGGVVDDIIVYCLEEGLDYLVCVNAANESKDWSWFQENNQGADLKNESSRWAQIAVQGPNALNLMSQSIGVDCQDMAPFRVIRGFFNDSEFILATTGYTGEKGGEIFIETNGAEGLWKDLLLKGDSLGVQAIGLGARDTLRTEMKYSLYGHEIDDTTSPLEADLGWTVKIASKDFIGKSELLKFKEAGLQRNLVGFKTTEKGIPRQGYNILDLSGNVMGLVTSGTHSPTLDAPIGIGYVSTAFSKLGSEIYIDIRGRKVAAVVCETPFIKRG